PPSRPPDASSETETGSAVAVSLARCVRQDDITLSGPQALVDASSSSPPPEAAAPAAGAESPVLEGAGLVKEVPLRSGVLRRVTGSVRAVDDVSLTIPPGTTLGLVGESGSGKSTLACVVLRLIDPTAGKIVVNGTDISTLRGPSLRRHRDSMQM